MQLMGMSSVMYGCIFNLMNYSRFQNKNDVNISHNFWGNPTGDKRGNKMDCHDRLTNIDICKASMARKIWHMVDLLIFWRTILVSSLANISKAYFTLSTDTNNYSFTWESAHWPKSKWNYHPITVSMEGFIVSKVPGEGRAVLWTSCIFGKLIQ